jgi:hypothetical protein
MIKQFGSDIVKVYSPYYFVNLENITKKDTLEKFGRDKDLIIKKLDKFRKTFDKNLPFFENLWDILKIKIKRFDLAIIFNNIFNKFEDLMRNN